VRIVADLHVHSRFSLATSPKTCPASLDRWARIKGVGLLGTGDCTHPAWLAELEGALEPSGEGLYRLRDDARREFDSRQALLDALPPAEGETLFVLTGEVCTIYSRDGRTRKVHHLVILPDFEAAAAFQRRLERVGNIASDGRPILGLDSRDLFSLLLDADDRSVLVPAHIWTPWFSALGARSGFDSVDECYGELAQRVRAVETGLSSNPPMNWAVEAVDRFSIISNSDAHSPDRIGREATILEMELSYPALAQALSGGGNLGRIAGTIEFFPQEGKYHFDGHRACGIALTPEESAERRGLCPVCGKPLTPGVMSRVAELAGRSVDETAPCPPDSALTNRRPYHSLVPLVEILSELLSVGSSSKRVAAAYYTLVESAGNELALLMDSGESELEALGRRSGELPGELLAEAIGRMRRGEVHIKPGFDGVYGRIRVFAPGFRIESASGAALFRDAEGIAPRHVMRSLKKGPSARAAAGAGEPEAPLAAAEVVTKARTLPVAIVETIPTAPPDGTADRASPLRLEEAQERAVRHRGGPALVVAGPGTGKTAVLAIRVERLVEAGVDPRSILALTFTNKAAQELRERIRSRVGVDRAATITVGTFHSFCRTILRDRAADASLLPDFSILDDPARLEVLSRVAGGPRSAPRLGAYIEGRKRFLLLPGNLSPVLGPGAPEGLDRLAEEIGLPAFDAELDSGYEAYRQELKAAASLDFDDLVAGTVRLLAASPPALAETRGRFRALFVDEYQDLDFAQYALVRILSPEGRDELFVIGDPDQAIYSFRGADSRFIARFLADYPDAAVYRLTRSFRCAPAIIGAAGRLVGADLSGTGRAVALSRREYPTDRSEAEGVAREIDRMIGGTRFFARDSGVVGTGAKDPGPAGGALARARDCPVAVASPSAADQPLLRSLAECAILMRASALAQPIEKALRDHGIPYRLVGERPWWEGEPCRSILSLLRTPSRWEGLSPAEAVLAAASLLAAPGKARRAAEEEPAARLAARARRHGDLAAFLEELALGDAQDGLERRAEEVALMSMHAAKGLEFDHVFVIALEDGLVPLTIFGSRGGERASDSLDEERRLLYVAMTRARVGLHLSWARSRHYRGRGLALPPSRFLESIEDLIPFLENDSVKRKSPQLDLF
jgi:DNA helicase-2/ATP-dependent DNA helicase PcrA